ncbi:hypothetical protein RB195_008016 [Necator americanus]|uniref:Uncharacterized protein n=1 Tax=Necator americanus TaxID=51031 RepID=A0ABR1C386_NECAM
MLAWRFALRQLCPVAVRSHLLATMQAVRSEGTTEDHLQWTAATDGDNDNGDCDVSASFTLPSSAFPFQPSVSSSIDDGTVEDETLSARNEQKLNRSRIKVSTSWLGSSFRRQLLKSMQRTCGFCNAQSRTDIEIVTNENSSIQ